jgi:hypothetical protein
LNSSNSIDILPSKSTNLKNVPIKSKSTSNKPFQNSSNDDATPSHDHQNKHSERAKEEIPKYSKGSKYSHKPSPKIQQTENPPTFNSNFMKNIHDSDESLEMIFGQSQKVQQPPNHSKQFAKSMLNSPDLNKKTNPSSFQFDNHGSMNAPSKTNNPQSIKKMKIQSQEEQFDSIKYSSRLKFPTLIEDIPETELFKSKQENFKTISQNDFSSAQDFGKIQFTSPNFLLSLSDSSSDNFLIPNSLASNKNTNQGQNEAKRGNINPPNQKVSSTYSNKTIHLDDIDSDFPLKDKPSNNIVPQASNAKLINFPDSSSDDEFIPQAEPLIKNNTIQTFNSISI